MLKFQRIRNVGWIAGAFFLYLFFAGNALGAEPEPGECVETSAKVGDATYLGCEVDSIDVFKGIRYATAERWEAPIAIAPSGNVDAGKYGCVCPQNPYDKNTMSEDCLFLNVWAPSGAKNLPVMVFIHGGGFIIGDGSTPLYDGENLAKQNNMVVVTLNYRLGIFGFFYKHHDQSGNFGIIDQITALRWVHDNIQAFGGDPGKVTIVGESAGAMSVGIHLALQESQAYFSNVVAESPYYGVFYKSAGEAERMSKIVKGLGCVDNTCSPEKLVFIEETFLLTFLKYGLKDLFGFTPYIDNILLIEQPINVKTRKPVVMGNNKAESLLFTAMFPNILVELIYKPLVADIFGKKLMAKILEKSRYNTKSQKAIDALNNLIDDALFVCGTDYVLANLKASQQTFGYAYNYAGNYSIYGTKVKQCEDAACHGSELPFVFDNHPGVEKFSDRDQNMADEMGLYWSNFINNGDPGAVNDISWLAYGGHGRFNLPAEKDPGERYTTDSERNCRFWQEEFYEKGGTKGAVQRLLERAGVAE